MCPCICCWYALNHFLCSRSVILSLDSSLAHIQIEMLLSSWVKLSGLQGLARTHGAVEYCSDQRQGAA